MSHIFISYKSEDGNFVSQEINRLSRTYRLWWDKTNIHGGEDWEKAIEIGLDESVALIVVLSPRVGDSKYVRFEYETALRKGKPVIPVIYEDCEIPVPLQNLQWIKVANDNWYQELTKALEEKPDIDEAELSNTKAKIEESIGDANLTFEALSNSIKGVIQFDKNGANLIGLPMLVTQYAMTYLVGKADANLQRQPEIQLALQISQGYNSPNFPVQVAKYILSRQMPLNMLLIRGPMSLTQHPQHGINMVHGLDNSNDKEWLGIVNATYNSIERYHMDADHPEMIHVFNIAPAALMGAIGLRAERGMGMTFYNFAGAAKYEPIFTRLVK